MQQFTLNRAPFLCRDIKAVLKEKDELMIAIQNYKEEIEVNKESFKRHAEQLEN